MATKKTSLPFPLRPITIVSAALKAESETNRLLILRLETEMGELETKRDAYAISAARGSKTMKILFQLSPTWDMETCYGHYSWECKSRPVWVSFEKHGHSCKVELTAKRVVTHLAALTTSINALTKKRDAARRACQEIEHNRRASKDWVSTILRADPEAAETIAAALRGALAKYSAA